MSAPFTLSIPAGVAATVKKMGDAQKSPVTLISYTHGANKSRFQPRLGPPSVMTSPVVRLIIVQRSSRLSAVVYPATVSLTHALVGPMIGIDGRTVIFLYTLPPHNANSFSYQPCIV